VDNAQGNELEFKNLSLTSEVKIDNGKKIIHLTSPFVIYSTVDTDYTLILDKEDREIEIPIKNLETKSIPIDFIRGSLALRAEGSEVVS